MRIGGMFFLLGLVLLALGASYIWRSRVLLRPDLVSRYRNSGVIVMACGAIVFLGSFLVIAQRGF